MREERGNGNDTGRSIGGITQSAFRQKYIEVDIEDEDNPRKESHSEVCVWCNSGTRHTEKCWKKGKDSTKHVRDTDCGSIGCYHCGEDGPKRMDCLVKGRRDARYHGENVPKENDQENGRDVSESSNPE